MSESLWIPLFCEHLLLLKTSYHYSSLEHPFCSTALTVSWQTEKVRVIKEHQHSMTLSYWNNGFSIGTAIDWMGLYTIWGGRKLKSRPLPILQHCFIIGASLSKVASPFHYQQQQEQARRQWKVHKDSDQTQDLQTSRNCIHALVVHRSVTLNKYKIFVRTL